MTDTPMSPEPPEHRPIRDGPPTEPPFRAESVHILVVERRPRGVEALATVPSTTSRIRAAQPRTAVSVAYSGWEALEIMRRGNVRFDFVVIDANVGWMDPVDFVRRAQSLDPVLPAIITCATGHGAVLVPPPDAEIDATSLFPRHLLRAVLRQLRSGTETDRVDEEAEQRMEQAVSRPSANTMTAPVAEEAWPGVESH